jgi:hypothetical protein
MACPGEAILAVSLLLSLMADTLLYGNGKTRNRGLKANEGSCFHE